LAFDWRDQQCRVNMTGVNFGGSEKLKTITNPDASIRD